MCTYILCREKEQNLHLTASKGVRQKSLRYKFGLKPPATYFIATVYCRMTFLFMLDLRLHLCHRKNQLFRYVYALLPQVCHDMNFRQINKEKQGVPLKTMNIL